MGNWCWPLTSTSPGGTARGTRRPVCRFPTHHPLRCGNRTPADSARSAASTPAQEFEYDWAGVIFGEDLMFREKHGWRAQQGKTRERSLQNTSPSFFDRLGRNTYKVLMTRGMQGVCLHSVAPETNEFLRHFAR
ncbi:DNA/RNA helicase domain-containing protein [Saccharopolyspora sp. 5N102]|uniref:DNA/RNA helicase domain-containing protein n=1 Tax=Saccharopolyspora sp. 5N102 TaxID=3375155 RepID=UPI0037A0D96A